MEKGLLRLGIGIGLAFTGIQPSYALDSYRFLHVTIETPWLIFIFLLGTIFVPFILMAILVWRYTERTTEAEKNPEPASKEQQ